MDVFGSKSHIDSYSKYLRSAIVSTGQSALLSIGSGDGAVEVEVAKLLRQSGVRFNFNLLEISPVQIERAQRRIAEEGLQQHFVLHEVDVNAWEPKAEFAGIMAHHSLHHVVQLERLFDGVKKSLLGYFCSIDMIGRNGHMRWPEVLELVQLFWALLPPEKRKHAVLPNFENGFYNHDSSSIGFEGIR
jgi:hypothetical protein